MSSLDVIALNEDKSQLEVPQEGDTYNMPRWLNIGLFDVSVDWGIITGVSFSNRGSMFSVGATTYISNNLSTSNSFEYKYIYDGGACQYKTNATSGEHSFKSSASGVAGAAAALSTIAKFDLDSTAGNTRFLIYDVDNGTLERVSVGAPDSGGAGYKVLRIPN